MMNVRGQVVGLNTAMLQFAQGIGFAVPSTTVSWVAALLMRHGEVRRRCLGIAARNEPFAAELAVQLGQPKGIRVIEISQGSPAAHGGLQRDDLLLEVNGRAVTTIDELQRQMALDPSPDVDLLLWRKGARTNRRIVPSRKAAA